jgi:hypothetical protein
VLNTTNVTSTVFSASNSTFGFSDLQAGAKFLDISGSSRNVALLNANLDYALNNDLVGNYAAANDVIAGAGGGRTVGRCIVYPAYNMPSYGVGVAGVCLSPDAVAIATRIPSTTAPVQFVTTDPTTGLSVITSIHEDLTLGIVMVKTAISAGVMFGRPGMACFYKDSANA